MVGERCCETDNIYDKDVFVQDGVKDGVKDGV